MKGLLASLWLGSCVALSSTSTEKCLSQPDSDQAQQLMVSLNHDWSSLALLYSHGISDSSLNLVTGALNRIGDEAESIKLSLANKTCVEVDSQALIDSSNRVFNTLQSNLDVYFVPLMRLSVLNGTAQRSNLTVQLESGIGSENKLLEAKSAAPQIRQNQGGENPEANINIQFFESFGKRAVSLLKRATRNKDGDALSDNKYGKEGKDTDKEESGYRFQGDKISGHDTQRPADINPQSRIYRNPSSENQYAYTAIVPQYGQVQTFLPPYEQPSHGQAYGQPPYEQPQQTGDEHQSEYQFQPRYSRSQYEADQASSLQATSKSGYSTASPPAKSEQAAKELSKKTLEVILHQLDAINSVFIVCKYNKSGTLVISAQHRVLEYANRLKF